MKHTYLLFFLLLTLAGKAQVAFEHVYGSQGNETARAMATAAHDALLLAGNSDSTALVVKVNVAGDTIWQRCYADTVDRFITSIIVLRDGNYLFAAENSVSQGLLLVKTDTSGNELWRQMIAVPGNNPQVQEASDSTLYIGLRTYIGQCVFGLMKCDASGNLLWQRNYQTGPSSDYFADLDATPDGGFLLTGTSYNFPQGPVTYIIKTDAQGDSLWARNFGYNLHVANAALTSDSGFIFGGYYTNSAWYDYVALEKTDASGNQQWFRNYPAAYSNHSGCCAVIPGGYAIAGVELYMYSGTIYDLRIYKVDSTGNLVWSKLFGGAQDESPAAVIGRPGNGIAALGTSASFAYGSNDLYLISVDSVGDVPCPQALDFQIVGSHCVQNMLTFNNNTVVTTNYEWLVNGQLVDSTIDGSHSFAQPGTYNISLVGCGDTLTKPYYIATPQTVGFTWTLNNLTLIVADTNAGISLWYWDFGDGGPSGETATDTNIYAAPGNYQINFLCLDSNGCACQVIQVITVVSVNEIAEGLGMLSVLPNPASDEVHVHWTGTVKTKLTLHLREITGREIMQTFSTTGDFIIQRGELPAGLYFIEISDGTNIVASGKLLFH